MKQFLLKQIYKLSIKLNYSLKLLLSNDIPDLQRLLNQGTYFPHPVGIVIYRYAKIGNNCTIHQNVTIGAKGCPITQKFQHPTIGNNVLIYAGAVIIGDITVGDNSVIAANAVVMNDVEPNSIVGGIPAKKIGINNE